MIKPHLGDDPNQLISIFLDSRAASCSIIKIDGIVPSHFFFCYFFSIFDGFIFRRHTEILIAEVFANNERRKKNQRKWNDEEPEGKKDPAARG